LAKAGEDGLSVTLSDYDKSVHDIYTYDDATDIINGSREEVAADLHRIKMV